MEDHDHAPPAPVAAPFELYVESYESRTDSVDRTVSASASPTPSSLPGRTRTSSGTRITSSSPGPSRGGEASLQDRNQQVDRHQRQSGALQMADDSDRPSRADPSMTNVSHTQEDSASSGETLARWELLRILAGVRNSQPRGSPSVTSVQTVPSTDHAVESTDIENRRVDSQTHHAVGDGRQRPRQPTPAHPPGLRPLLLSQSPRDQQSVGAGSLPPQEGSAHLTNTSTPQDRSNSGQHHESLTPSVPNPQVGPTQSSRFPPPRDTVQGGRMMPAANPPSGIPPGRPNQPLTPTNIPMKNSQNAVHPSSVLRHDSAQHSPPVRHSALHEAAKAAHHIANAVRAANRGTQQTVDHTQAATRPHSSQAAGSDQHRQRPNAALPSAANIGQHYADGSATAASALDPHRRRNTTATNQQHQPQRPPDHVSPQRQTVGPSVGSAHNNIPQRGHALHPASASNSPNARRQLNAAQSASTSVPLHSTATRPSLQASPVPTSDAAQGHAPQSLPHTPPRDSANHHLSPQQRPVQAGQQQRSSSVGAKPTQSQGTQMRGATPHPSPNQATHLSPHVPSPPHDQSRRTHTPATDALHAQTKGQANPSTRQPPSAPEQRVQAQKHGPQSNQHQPPHPPAQTPHATHEQRAAPPRSPERSGPSGHADATKHASKAAHPKQQPLAHDSSHALHPIQPHRPQGSAAPASKANPRGGTSPTPLPRRLSQGIAHSPTHQPLIPRDRLQPSRRVQSSGPPVLRKPAPDSPFDGAHNAHADHSVNPIAHAGAENAENSATRHDEHTSALHRSDAVRRLSQRRVVSSSILEIRRTESLHQSTDDYSSSALEEHAFDPDSFQNENLTPELLYEMLLTGSIPDDLLLSKEGSACLFDLIRIGMLYLGQAFAMLPQVKYDVRRIEEES
ncbi:hypothetical protein LTR66_001415 [Elasticomyces elasticus]|nr:hypothetical protein LTR66_001415 [Elasticomyces elasticus]